MTKPHTHHTHTESLQCNRIVKHCQADSAPLSHAVVLNFQEVWHRSFCRTIEKLVEVVQEYPGEVEHIYSPSCVPLVRCAGCCGDDNMECHPTHTSNVTMLVRRRPSDIDNNIYIM